MLKASLAHLPKGPFIGISNCTRAGLTHLPKWPFIGISNWVTIVDHWRFFILFFNFLYFFLWFSRSFFTNSGLCTYKSRKRHVKDNATEIYIIDFYGQSHFWQTIYVEVYNYYGISVYCQITFVPKVLQVVKVVFPRNLYLHLLTNISFSCHNSLLK